MRRNSLSNEGGSRRSRRDDRRFRNTMRGNEQFSRDDERRFDSDNHRDVGRHESFRDQEYPSLYRRDREDWGEYAPASNQNEHGRYETGRDFEDRGLLGRRGYRGRDFELDDPRSHNRSGYDRNSSSRRDDRSWESENYGMSRREPEPPYTSSRNPESRAYSDRGFDADPMWVTRRPGNDSSRMDDPGTFRDYREPRFDRQFERESNQGMHAGKGPRGYQRSDERIKEDVSECLRDDGEIDASEVDVTVNNGVVTLSGTVESRHIRRMAEECIESVSGVKDIENQLRVASTDKTQHDYDSSKSTTQTSKNKQSTYGG